MAAEWPEKKISRKFPFSPYWAIFGHLLPTFKLGAVFHFACALFPFSGLQPVVHSLQAGQDSKFGNSSFSEDLAKSWRAFRRRLAFACPCPGVGKGRRSLRNVGGLFTRPFFLLPPLQGRKFLTEICVKKGQGGAGRVCAGPKCPPRRSLPTSKWICELIQQLEDGWEVPREWRDGDIFVALTCTGWVIKTPGSHSTRSNIRDEVSHSS